MLLYSIKIAHGYVGGAIYMCIPPPSSVNTCTIITLSKCEDICVLHCTNIVQNCALQKNNNINICRPFFANCATQTHSRDISSTDGVSIIRWRSHNTELYSIWRNNSIICNIRSPSDLLRILLVYLSALISCVID